MIIAVDGPAASGKGTIAKALGRHYGLPVLDTGLLYRALGLAVLKSGGDPDIESDALAACSFGDETLADPALRSEAVGSLASRVSVHQAVRDALVKRQRDFATQPGGAILDVTDHFAIPYTLLLGCFVELCSRCSACTGNPNPRF